MRIGFDAKRFFHNHTGLGNYSRSLIKVLAFYYPEDIYLLYNPKEEGKINTSLPYKNIIEKLPVGCINKNFSSLWRWSRIVEDIKRDKIDIYHGLSGEIPRGIHRTNIKSIVTVHDLIFCRYPQYYKTISRNIYLKKVKYAVRHADRIIAITEQTKQDIINFLEIPKEKIQVIYQSCDDIYKKTYSQTQKDDTIKKYKLPKEFILNVGTVEKRKNILSVIKAIKDIDTHLVVIGSLTSYQKEILNFIKTNKMYHKVTFLQNVSLEDLSILYQCAKIFIYPSIFEGFGIPIIEALYSKTPVITSTGSCFSEAGGENTIYITPNNIEQMKYEIERLLNNSKLQKEMIDKGYSFVQKFNKDIIVAQYHQMYQNIFKT